MSVRGSGEVREDQKDVKNEEKEKERESGQKKHRKGGHKFDLNAPKTLNRSHLRKRQ